MSQIRSTVRTSAGLAARVIALCVSLGALFLLGRLLGLRALLPGDARPPVVTTRGSCVCTASVASAGAPKIAASYDTRLRVTLFACSNMACFACVIWFCADAFRRLKAQRSYAEANLQERNRQLEMIFRAACVGDWTWEAVTGQVTAHPVVWQQYGEPHHQGTEAPMWFERRRHPADLERVNVEVQRSIADRTILNTEFRVIQPDGSVRWVACRAQPVYDSSGKHVRSTGINFDITDRKLAEESVRESEKRLRELAEAMPQIVWTARADGSIDYYNRRWYEYTGLSFEQPWESALHPEDLAVCNSLFAASLAEGVPFEAEIRLRRASDGIYRWHLTRAVPIRAADSSIEGWFGTSTDIDDFKRASAELTTLNESLEERVHERSAQLAESEREYRLLLGAVRDYAILMLDETGKVVSWNTGAERIWGYTADEIIGKHFSIFFTEEDRLHGYPERELADAKRTGHYEEESLRVNKHGNKFWASGELTPAWNEDGTLRGFSKVTRDISQRKETEERLVAERRRAEEANSAKSRFLATMSHEIRTPMNAILGMADLLWETELNPTQREYVGRFRRAGSNLLALLNDILDLSKIEAGHFELESADFDLHELVERTIEMAETRARMKNIELTVGIEPRTPRFVTGDPARLQQILNNLVGNAIKFTEKGYVAVKVAIHSDAAPAHLHFQVSDSGIGIPADKTAAIFQDFAQAESSTTRRFGGTGLGLGISRRLVSRMGGQLSVESTLGKGSTFYFDVILSVSAANREPPSKDAVDLTGRRVLIVDDNSTNRLILREMCNSLGLRTEESANASDAARQVSQALRADHPFELVLLDSVMPDGEGLSVMKTLRQLDAAMPIILISSECAPGEATRARALGAAAFVSKPVRRDELAALLTNVLQRKTPAREGPPAKLLIAEDSEDNRFLLAGYLNEGRHHLTFVENGQEALDVFSRERFDIVLMDVQMPAMDGLTAATAMRAWERERSADPTPIIALTANALIEDVDRSRAAGCDLHLTKPITKEKLIREIDNLHRRARNKPEFTVNVPEGLEDLSRRYIANRYRELPQTLALASDGELDKVRVFGHNLKGTGTSYGFAALTELGGNIEEAAKESDVAAVLENLRKVREYVEYARTVLTVS